ncbi:LIM domain only protein 7b isoform X1 [Oncorhynchus mykiss]|uniref:LIM domain only protein 7b isoform X1 n=1 Tax=Oncorhynchus mykiss TaxID=8022 RepID=UPI001877A0E2|nr:LIM domain only protein 7b isoform X1 [Oncorhynchus mykiss]XP_036828255.1 LIM domain only protein 7b isoform X1 [Oncorhynchus mykiss]XP_036828256.1 LIM domain only protein 7b isoform X1 [Oncorhynchus mykiss]
MEWREQTSVTCEDAFTEAQRWMEEVTNKSFGSNNFRSALENGVLLCHLINQLKPGLIKRMNTLSTPMAGLDNVNVFLRACGTLGLHEAQLFHPGDLQDLSTRATLRCVESKRRLKNVLITIYWLGRKAQADPFYSGPQLNLKAFEGLLGIALSKALEETPRGSVTDRDYSDVIYPERDDELPLTRSQTPGYSREDSVESFNSALSFDSAESRTLSCISDSILRAGSEDSSSDVEAENSFRMKAAEGRESGLRNWGNVPAPFQRKKREENRIKGCLPSPLTRSKSLNDIRRFPSPTQVVRQVSEGGMELSPSAVSQDQLQMVRARVHESEAKWHNDLTKWKLRRHRSNCDLRRKMQERDNIVLMANAGVGTVGTFNSLQEDREEDEESLCSNGHKVSPSTSFMEGSLVLRPHTRAPTSVSEGSLELRPHTRAPLALSSSVESPYSPGASEPFTAPSVTLQGPGAVPQSEPLVLEGRRHTPVEPDGAGGLATFPNSASPISSQTISSPALFISTGRDHNVSLLSNGIPTTLPGSSSSLTTGTSSSLTTSDPVNGTGSNLTSGTGSNLTSGTGSHNPSASMDIPDQALLSTVESLTSVGAPGHVSAPQQQELPLYRYSSRAPGGRGRGSASLPRGYRRSEGSLSCLSAGFTPRPFGAKSSRVSSLPRLYNLENSLLNENGNGSLLPTKTAPTRPQKMVTISEVAVRAQPWATANQSSVNQEVEEGGSQTQPSILKTRGVPGPATHPKPLPPSLRPSLPVSVRQNGSAQVRHSDRVSLTLKINSRPHFGFNTHWDSTGARVGGIQPGSPAELCQLRAGDEIVSVGGHRVAEMSHSQWKGMMTSALQKGSLTMDVQRYGNNGPTDTSRDATMMKLAQINGQEVNVLTSKSSKGGFQDDPLTIRSKGGSASAISDLQVPSLSTSPSSWSWDPEEERRRQEKWQEEQERLLQEKYRQDQERLDAEWQQAQEEAGAERYRQAEVTPDPLPSRCIVGYVVPCVKSSTPNMESSGEMTNGIASLASPQPVLSQPMAPVAIGCCHVESNPKEVVFDGGRREEPRPQEGRNLEEETDEVAGGDKWSGDSYGFTQLSIADRMKSKSSPSLEGFHRQEVKGATREVARRKPPQSMSLVEAERQQILDEMRKRTALLTDNSWIRQRSTSDNRQPTNRRGPMRRYDSLDNLPSSATLLSNPQRPHSSLGFAAPYRPPSSRHSMGVALGGYSNGTQKHSPTWPRPFSTSSPPPNTGEEPATGESRPVSQQHHRVLTSRQVCSVCVCPMGRGAAMVIETLNLCFHLACFQCVDCRCRLGGSEVRAQIRISNGKPYCDPCYIRLKSHLATSL